MLFNKYFYAIALIVCTLLSCTPKYITQTYNKGVVEYNDSLYSDAILNFRLVYSVKPKYKKTLYYSGKTMLALGDTAGACAYLKQGSKTGKMQNACKLLYVKTCK